MLSKKLPSLRYPLTTTRSRSRSRSTALLLLKDAQCTANSLSSARSAIHLPIWEVKQTARSSLRRCWTLVDSRPVFRWSSPDIAVLLLLLLASLGPLGCSGNKARYSEYPGQTGDYSYYPADSQAFASTSMAAANQLLPSQFDSMSASPHKIATEGKVVFGGLFPMHEQGVGGSGQVCGRIKREKGIQRLEAMLYAVDLINNDTDILPGLTIGMHVLDTCSDDTFALEQCMDFIKAQLSSMDAEEWSCADLKPPIYRPMRPVAGVIGAASSPVSIMVANILRLFKIPQISYASTSTDLSDKTRFEYFSRVVPPDKYQAKAMADTARALGWTYVNTLADAGTYGEKGIQAFVDATKNSGLCVSRTESIPRGADEETILKIMHTLLLSGDNNADAIMMFVSEDNCRKVLKAIRALNQTNHVHLLASDSWGAKVHPVYKQEAEAEGTVTILPKRHVIPGFDEYFLNLTPENNTRNPWFKEFWSDIFNCSLDGEPLGMEACSGNESLKNWPNYKQEGLVQFVIDSVYAMAHAAHDMLATLCEVPIDQCPSVLQRLTGAEFLEYIRNVSFTGVSGDLVKFNEHGDSLGRYDIYQYQRSGKDEWAYVKVGEWVDRLNLNMSSLRWKNGSLERPTSICSEPCSFGESKINTSECCWMCVPCKENEFLDEVGECKACPSDSQPNATLTGCERLPIVTLVPTSLWFVLPVTFSLAGVLCTIFTLGVFLVFNKTPIIMASGRELCYILLFGITISYITSVAMLARPSMSTCLIRRFALGVSLCFVYAAILTKTNRIFRIFSVGIKAMVKRPSYTSPKSQIFICLALVSVQVVGAFTWLGFEKPDVVLTHHQKGQLVLRCRASQMATIVSLLYNIFLIVLCTVYAFKTRKIPQNFNEAKYIAFTMYSTCIVWVAFVPIYFGANHDFKIEVTSLCMCVNISATVALFCLFAPKVYIVLLQPHKNVRQTSAASLSTSGKTTARNFYDPSTASTGISGGGRDGPGGGGAGYARTMSSSSYSDLNGGVYCGEPTTNPLPFLSPKNVSPSNSQGLPGSNVVMTVPPPHQSSTSPGLGSARDFRKRNSAGHVIVYTPPCPPASSPYPGLVVHPSPTGFYSRDAHSMDNEIIEEDEDVIEEEKRTMFQEVEEEEEEEEAGEEDGMISHQAKSSSNTPANWSRLYDDANGASAVALSRLSDVTRGFPDKNHHEGKRPHMVPMCRHSCHTHPLPPLDDWGREDGEDSSSCDEARPARMLVTDIS